MFHAEVELSRHVRSRQTTGDAYVQDAGFSRCYLHIRVQCEQRIAVGPGNAHFISIHQVSSDAAALSYARRCC